MSRSRSRRRPFVALPQEAYAGDGSSTALALVDDVRAMALKGSSPDTQTIADVLALNATTMPAFAQYWMLYMKNPDVKSCVDMIANAVSANGYDVMAKRGADQTTIAKSSDAQQIDEFFDVAFVNQDTMRRALLTLSTDLKVYGLGYWRKRRLAGTVCGLERLDPRLVVPKPSPDRTKIQSFWIRKGPPPKTDSFGNPLPTLAPSQEQGETVSPADMIFFTLGGGDNLLGAPSPLEALDHTLGLDIAIRKFRQAFFTNGAVNGKILSSKTANRDQARLVEAMVKNSKRGANNAYSTWVILGEWSVVDKGNPGGQADFDFIKASRINLEEVSRVYGVPLGKLLFSDKALGSSGKAEDDHTFQENTVLPLEEAIYEILTMDLLVGEFGIENIELAPKRRMQLRYDMFDAAEQGIKIGMTGNEARELVGLPRIEGDPMMDVPMFTDVRAIGGVAGVEAAPQGPSAGSGGTSGNIEDANADIAGGGQTSAKGKAMPAWMRY